MVAAYCGVLYNSTPIISMTRTTPPKLSLSHEQAIFIAQAAKDKKAEDVLVLEVGDLTSLADFFIFASGESERQVRGLASFIEKMMATRYQTNPVIEGKETANWILLDYGDIIVHIFRSDIRQYYALEKMWADAPQIPIPESEHQLSPPRQLASG
ncbi:MAG: ribosome silencing factor [Nitrospirota bacterium]|nr:ribosome silencing factor [Nitrospirota bacterium]